MYSLDIPRNFITVLAACVLALVLTLMPNASAYAEETGTVEVTHRELAPQDANLLRRLLADPAPDPAQQLQLERVMDGVYEELADAASQARTSPQGKSFINSVNDLLGVKSGKAQNASQG